MQEEREMSWMWEMEPLLYHYLLWVLVWYWGLWIERIEPEGEKRLMIKSSNSLPFACAIHFLGEIVPRVFQMTHWTRPYGSLHLDEIQLFLDQAPCPNIPFLEDFLQMPIIINYFSTFLRYRPLKRVCSDFQLQRCLSQSPKNLSPSCKHLTVEEILQDLIRS